MTYYPTVGVQGIGCSITMNFGTEPFQFPISNMFEQAKMDIISSMTNKELSKINVNKLIRNYLLYSGYIKT